jgi:hypothetical protein
VRGAVGHFLQPPRMGRGVLASSWTPRQLTRLRVSSNGRYLESVSTGKPFFIALYSAWNLVVQLGDAAWSPSFVDQELSTLIAELQQHHVTHVMVQVLSKWGSNPSGAVLASTRDGIAPFTSTIYSTPNESYFARLDTIFGRLLDAGIGLLVAWNYKGWAGDAGGGEGFYNESVAAGVSVVQEYARYCGDRWKGLPLVWLFSGDNTPPHTGTAEDDPKFIQAEAAGLDAAGASQLRTVHLAGDNHSEEVEPAQWDFATVYGWKLNTGGLTTVHDLVLTAYAASAKPLLGIEFVYEAYALQLGGDPERNLRSQWWQAFLGGCTAGVAYGSVRTGFFNGDTSFNPGGNWYDDLDSLGIRHFQVFVDFVNSIAFHTLEPAEGTALVSAGGGTRNTSGYLSRAFNGTNLAACYSYNGAAFTMQMGLFAGPVTATYYDPTNGAQFPAAGSSIPNSGTHEFNPATERGNNARSAADWVLLLQVLPA